MVQRQKITHSKQTSDCGDCITSSPVKEKMACSTMRDNAPATTVSNCSAHRGLPPDSFTSVNRQVTEDDFEPPEDGDIFLNSASAGRDHLKSKDYIRALSSYKTALRCKRTTIEKEPKHIQAQFADILFNIGRIHMLPQFDDKTKSLEAFHICLALRRICFGSSHPSVATVLCKLASIYHSFGEQHYTLELLLEALSIFLFEKGNNSTLAEVWTALGKVQQSLGRADEAESSFQEAARLSK